MAFAHFMYVQAVPLETNPLSESLFKHANLVRFLSNIRREHFSK